MNRLICWILLVAILVEKGLSNPNITASQEDDDEDWDDEDDSSEADDDSRIYKNPRNSPSTECPRDEEQATLLGQKCLRKCSSDEDCKSKKKKCLCDGVCGMSCIKPDRECPELDQPALGEVTMPGRHFGSRATYTCPHGYHVVGLQSRLCQADGNWAGTEPACKQNIYCLTPPLIEHARHSALPEQTTFDLDATVQYHCHTGYVTNGFPRAKCLALDGHASWFGPDIQCEPRSCGQPSDPANGWHAGECYTFGCRVIYHCGDGYELVGKGERSCQADGSWIPKELPTCVLVTSVQCPIPDNPKYGKAIYTTFSYNSVVSYECKYGFTLIGESSRRCGADRKWSGSLPTCKEINCGHPGILYNGWLENIEAGFGLGASIIFRCHPEMLLEGPSSTVCQIDGKWRYSVPQCLAPCIVPTISQGQVIPTIEEIDMNATTIAAPPVITSIGKVKHATSLEVICDDHYEFPISTLTPPTCNNGTWSVIPRCIPARCKSMPKPPKHGMVLAPKTDHGMKARFKCKDGFNLTGPGGKEVNDLNEYVLTCMFGNWTGETPNCQEVYCSFPGYIPNGKVLLVGNMGLYDYRPYVKKIVNNKQIMYECDKGYVFKEGPPGATCVGGKWRPTELPICVPGLHPRLRITRRRRSTLSRKAQSMLINRERTKRSKLNELYKNLPRGSLNVFQNNHKDPLEIEEALIKYYEKNKGKHHNFIKSLLGFDKNNKIRKEKLLKEINSPRESIHVKDRHSLNSNINWDTMQNPQRFSKSYSFKDKKYKDVHLLENMPNNLNGFKSLSKNQNNLKNFIHNYDNTSSKNLTDPVTNFKLQKIRQKRDVSTKNNSQDSRAERHTFVVEENTEETINREERRGRARVPCEELDLTKIANLTVIRQGKSPGHNSAGTILNIECQPGYKLNLKSNNATTRCIRGIWKPQKPKCFSAPCSVPSTEHGKYFEMTSIPLTANTKPRLLMPFEEVDNGQTVVFQCEDGFNIQGISEIQCKQGEWSVSAFPDCIPVPCTLPEIQNIVYEGGYRSGLTIAHGSSVTVHCDNPINNLPIQMICNKGEITPPTIHCETGSRRSREEYLSEAEFVSSDNNLISIMNRNSNGIVSNGAKNVRVIEGGKDCGSPSKIDASLVYKNGEKIDSEEGFPSGTEITFNCIASVAGERNTWKIICEDGNWIGRAISCANGTCMFRNNEPNVVSFYNDLEIREDIVEFPPGATIISRCVDIGKYAMMGSGIRSCIHSEWSGQRPSCFGLNQENDYAMEKAPTILFRHQNGPIAQSNDGKLIVYPGTTVHMECLWMRRFGNPKWNVSHDYRTYPEGWVTEEGRDPQLEYRLSIFHAVEDDSGTFTCQTPARHEHSVEVLVKSINCPDIPTRRGLILNSNDTRLSSRILLSCANGNSLIGASELICLPSGNWSSPLPVCESVECGDIPLIINNTSPRVAVLSREVGGRASFSCPTGYGLRGPSETICLPSGEWATPFPSCIEVQCSNPDAPQNGYAQGSLPYRAGDVVQFNCNPEYMMQGQPIIACQDNGRWSGGLPKCVQACSYPGTAISGRMSSVKFYYAIGESITFTCDAGLELRGAKMLKCLRNGKWSNAIPTCVNSEQTKRSSGFVLV